MYIWITKNGNHIKIKNKQSPMDAFIKQASKTEEEQIISKKEYGRLAHLINSNPDKWRKGINSQIIDDKIYYFVYNDYDDFEIIEVKDFKE